MRLITLPRGHRLLFGGLLAIALAQSLVVIVPAWAVKQLFDRFSGHEGATSLSEGALTGLFVAMALLAFALEVTKRRLGSEIGLRHAARLRTRLFRRLLKDSAVGGGVADKGTLLLPFVGDLTASRRWVGEGLPRAASALIIVPVLVAIIASSSLSLAAAIAGVLCLSTAASLLLSSPLDRAVREVRRRRGALTGFIAGRLEAAATIKASGRSRQEARKVETRTEKLSAAERRRAWVTGATRGLGQLTNSLLVLATLLVGVHEISSGAASLGEVVAVLSLVGLMGAGVTDLTRAFELWHPARVAEERIERILKRAPGDGQRGPSAPPASESGMIVLEGLTVGERLRQISAQACPGDIILVDGASGSGKSTLLGAIAQIVRPTAGSIRFDGRALANIKESERRTRIGFAGPSSAILPGSLKMNIGYRLAGTSDERVRELAVALGLSPLIDRLPKGIEGRISEQSQLAAFERAAITLARAMIGDPPLVLLDGIDAQLSDRALEWLERRIADYPGIVLLVSASPKLRPFASRHWLLTDGLLRQSSHSASEPVIGQPAETPVIPFRGRRP